MQVEAFEAALRLIMPGPADQPLMRILRLALDISDCPMGMIGVRRPDVFELVVSSGIPLSGFRRHLKRSSEIEELLREPLLIEDLLKEPAFAHHPFVSEPARWRFLASVPVPLSILPYPVLLICADPRLKIKRRPDLLERLSECAAIAADELAMIGDIAYQSEKLAEMRATTLLRDDGLRASATPMALIGADSEIEIANDRFKALTYPAVSTGATRLSDVFPADAQRLEGSLQSVFDNGKPANALIARTPGQNQSFLVDLMRVVTVDSTEPKVLCTVTEANGAFRGGNPPDRDRGDPPPVVSEFLLSTLVWNKRLLRRGDVPYHAIARWRSSVRDAQIAALKALKRDPEGHLLDMLTDRFAAAAISLFGRGTFQAVVPVPCGHSGPNCLSRRLAERLSERLALPFIDAFEPIPVTGSSHPRRNASRPVMKLVSKPKVPVLLIDDVATSGAHIEEAAQMLRRSAPAVLPLVWIAD